MYNLDRDGYALADLVFTDTTCEELAAAMPEIEKGSGGVRHLLGHEAVRRVLTNSRFARTITPFVGLNAVAVNATLFDKTPASNWRVFWHQDRTIHVRKNGEGRKLDAPSAVLEQMVAARIHLDDAGHENGPLRVIPRSHRLGKLDDDRLLEVSAKGPQVELHAPRGSILLMRPLLVHASSPAASPAHRRVLHIEFAPRDAVVPLEWDLSISLG
jgi:ectoine hydroxylase-related dioxygenase (phytanoyl-CoA dioxygenase family)